MSTITTVLTGVVVVGLILAAIAVFVTVLANLASRNGQALRFEFDARRLRLKIQITPARGRDATPPVAPVDGAPSGTSEKSS